VNVNLVNTAATSNKERHTIQCPFDINEVIHNAKSQNLQDAVEVLRFLQERIVKGRQLVKKHVMGKQSLLLLTGTKFFKQPSVNWNLLMTTN